MNCIKSELIQKYIDKAASEEEMVMVKTHLAICPECTAQLTEMHQRSERIKKAMNLLVSDDKTVPGFIKPMKSLQIREVTQRKRLISSLSAACVLICIVMVILFSSKTRPQQEIVVIHSCDQEINANKTVTQQEMEIQVIDNDGKITQYPLK
jgi:predicted anti-sigma-YlaC factor YlaD